MNKFFLDLQLFADEGAGAAAGAVTAGDAGTAGVQGDDAGLQLPPRKHQRSQKPNPLENVQYGRAPESPSEAQAQDLRQIMGSGQDDAAKEPEDRAARWAKLREEFADEYGKDVQDVIAKRFKNQKDNQASLDAIAPVMQQLAARFGIEDANDYQSIAAAFMDDDALYEDEAMEKGLPVRVVKQMHQLQAEHEQIQAQREKAEQEQMFEQHIQNLAQQGEALKQIFPNFDLRTELQNPEFARLTSPQVGVSVQDAYYVVHRREIEPAAMQYGVQQTVQRMSQAIQAGAVRPRENGSGTQAGVEVRTDPTKFTKQDFAEIRRRVQRGERITF